MMFKDERERLQSNFQENEMRELKIKLSQSLNLIDQMTDCYFNSSQNNHIKETFNKAFNFSSVNEQYK